MFKYMLLFIWIILLFSIYSILLIALKKRMNDYLNKKKREIEIFNELIEMAKKIRSKEHILKKKPCLALYLSQADYIIKNKGFYINTVEICTIKETANQYGDLFDKDKFYFEYKSASKEIVNLVDDCSVILGKIYQLNHPVKYYFTELKKNIYMRFLYFLVKVISHQKLYKSKQKIKNKTTETEIKNSFINEPLSVVA